MYLKQTGVDDVTQALPTISYIQTEDGPFYAMGVTNIKAVAKYAMHFIISGLLNYFIEPSSWLITGWSIVFFFIAPSLRPLDNRIQ
jgi:hypothetical protein